MRASPGAPLHLRCQPKGPLCCRCQPKGSVRCRCQPASSPHCSGWPEDVRAVCPIRDLETRASYCGWPSLTSKDGLPRSGPGDHNGIPNTSGTLSSRGTVFLPPAIAKGCGGAGGGRVLIASPVPLGLYCGSWGTASHLGLAVGCVGVVKLPHAVELSLRWLTACCATVPL